MENETTVQHLKIGDQKGNTAEASNRFLGIIKKLRDPNGGCPWDLKQTFESLKSQVIEEDYEVADSDDYLCEELTVLYAVWEAAD